MKLYKLIIVDDERFTLRTLADAVPWNKYGFETKCFVSPEEAIGWAEENFVDAVITDVNMPIINGNEMMERIRKIYPDVVFAVLSGYDEFIYVQKALQLGAIDYIIKPIGFDAIEALCKKIYERLNKNEADEKKKILSKVKEIMRNAVVGIKPEALYNMQFLSDNPVAIVHCNNEALKEYLKSSQYTKDDLYRSIDNIVLFNDNTSSNIWMRLELNIGDLDFISIKLFQNDDFQQSLINEINMIKNDIEQLLGFRPGLDIVDTYDNIQAFINEQNKISEHDDLVQKLYKLITEEGADVAHEAIQSLYDNCINSKLSFKKAVKDVLENFGDIIDVSSVSDEQAFALLMNHIENNIRNEGNTERNKAVLRRFKKYIEEHYMEDLSLDDIAGYMHMSPSYFSKYIKKLCGEKYIDYLISVRLEHAGKLLLEEDCTVSRLYEKVGFRSSQNFYRMFNRYYGCTPKEYREMFIQRKVKKSRSNIYTNYKWTSVFFKYLILITLFFVVPTVVVGIFTISYYNGKNENAQRVEYINIVSKCSGVIEKSLSVVYEDAQYISINERIGNLLKSDNVLNKKTIQLAAEVYNTVNDRVCDSVYLYSLKSGYVFSCKGFGSNYFDRFPDKNWLERCGEPMPIYRHFLYANRSYGYISVITPISYLNEHVGYAVHNIDTWSFDEELMNILKQEDCLLLTDNDGTVIYATDKTLIGTSVNVEEYKNGKPIIRYADDEIYVSSEIESNGLNCIIKAPRYPLKYQRFTFAGAVTAIMLLIIILSIFLVFIIASNFYRQIQNILDLFNGTQEEVAENGINEFSYISANIIGLMEKNKLTEIQLAARIEQVRETQRILAQSRINSHFLMNTLHLVNVIIMSIVKKENKATYAIKLLSDMLKSSLNSTRTIIPLSEDVEFAEKYMQIVNMRYDNVVKIIWNIKEEHLGVYVPKLMLQPIIENAVTHGLLPSKNENKTIEISSFEEKGSVYVVVSDNGVGIEENKQKEINLMMSESFEKWSYCMIKKNRFGLDNTNKCLKLIFGDECGCSIESNPGHGTRVYIKIKKS